jgi:heme/copper-type cytochrome/quinol oxidase subunit 3
MSLTEQTEFVQREKAKKMLLWFSMISLAMSFAGLTSAYVVSKERADWLENLVLPSAFGWSLVVILLSSLTFEWAKRALKRQENQHGTLLLWITWILGLGFMALQYMGFSQIYNDFGYAFTGPTSSIAYTFIFLIVVLHLCHVLAALIALSVVIYNHYKQRYILGKTLGVELAALFWHFVDGLWLYLFLFFYFVR